MPQKIPLLENFLQKSSALLAGSPMLQHAYKAGVRMTSFIFIVDFLQELVALLGLDSEQQNEYRFMKGDKRLPTVRQAVQSMLADNVNPNQYRKS